MTSKCSGPITRFEYSKVEDRIQCICHISEDLRVAKWFHDSSNIPRVAICVCEIAGEG